MDDDRLYHTPFTALALGEAVVVTGVDGVGVAMTAEAVLGSLEALRTAAEEAIRNREQGAQPQML